MAVFIFILLITYTGFKHVCFSKPQRSKERGCFVVDSFVRLWCWRWQCDLPVLLPGIATQETSSESSTGGKAKHIDGRAGLLPLAAPRFDAGVLNSENLPKDVMDAGRRSSSLRRTWSRPAPACGLARDRTVCTRATLWAERLATGAELRGGRSARLPRGGGTSRVSTAPLQATLVTSATAQDTLVAMDASEQQQEIKQTLNELG